jgi:tRNA-(ms[2]io[6]A)-hydroxylase
MSTEKSWPMANWTLRFATPAAWVETVMANFDQFLIDHAAAEKKAAGMAISMLSHYHDKMDVVAAMTELAVEEMTHFKEVVKLIHARGLNTLPDERDKYIVNFRRHIRNGRDEYFLDRLLIGGIIEARGAERFGLIADALPDGSLKGFYRGITRTEHRHEDLMIDLARVYFPEDTVCQRLNELLDIEAEICAALPIKAALH